MHHVQKKAALAIISMVEAGLRELRTMLSDNDVQSEPGYAVHRPRPEPSFGSPLDDREEASLEQMMEASRLDMVRRGTGLAQEFYSDAAPPIPGDFFQGDDI